MGIAYKCDVTGVYADSMDRIKSHDFTVTKGGKSVRVRISIEVLDQNGEAMYLAGTVWSQVIDEVKARI